MLGRERNSPFASSVRFVRKSSSPLLDSPPPPRFGFGNVVFCLEYKKTAKSTNLVILNKIESIVFRILHNCLLS
jgi:hypothetical protein